MSYFLDFFPQEIALYNELSIDETLLFFARLHGMAREDFVKRKRYCTWHMHTFTPDHTCLHTCMHARALVHMHAHVHTRTDTHSRHQARPQPRTHSHPNTLTGIFTHARDCSLFLCCFVANGQMCLFIVIFSWLIEFLDLPIESRLVKQLRLAIRPSTNHHLTGVNGVRHFLMT